SHGGDFLLSVGADSTSRLWDPMTGRQLFQLPGGLACEFGPDDRGLDSGWQLATGRECRTFHGPKYLYGVAVSPAGGLLASASETGVQPGDPAATRESDKELATLPAWWSSQARFDPKGESLITAGSQGLRRWPITPDPETGGLRVDPPQALGLSARAPLSSEEYADFALSPDGRTVAYFPRRGQALLFDLEDPHRKLLLEGPCLRHPAFSPDGRWLATGNWEGRGVKAWDARTGDLAHDLEVGGREERGAWPAFSPDGQWLVTGTFTEYRFWEVGSWRPKHALPRQNAGNAIGWVVFSPDGRMVALLQSL